MIRDKLSSGLRRLFGGPASQPSPAPARSSAPPPSAEPPVTDVSLDPAAVERVIDERIRPALRADGGDIELVEVRGADVHVRLQGACRGCPGASMTLRMGVEALLRDELQGFGRVVDLG